MHEQMREYNEKVQSHVLPKFCDFPDIDLYMDQVIALMQKYLGPYMISEDMLTPSMINNYVKINALPAPVSKRYSKEHIARLVVICLMKRQLSIPVISNIIEEQVRSSGLENFYNSFVSSYEASFKAAAQDVNSQDNLLICSLNLAICAAVNHTMAEIAVSICDLDHSKEHSKEKNKK